MSKFIILILIIIIIFIFLLYIYLSHDLVRLDMNYFGNKIYKKIIGNTIIDNTIIGNTRNEIKKPSKILLITCDNRPDIEFVKLHNLSFETYAKKHSNIDYNYYTDCGTENIYWSRLFLIRNLMMQNKYDWIGWVDSDTIIINENFDLTVYLNGYDIFIADDNRPHKEGINSGIFFIKNSEIGFNFINDVIEQYKKNKHCKDQKNKLFGMFGGFCYEQAQMEILLSTKYKSYVNVIDKNIVLCSKNDIDIDIDKEKNSSIFIYHLIGSTTETRDERFSKIYKLKNKKN
jgi:hypothetical protein